MVRGGIIALLLSIFPILPASPAPLTTQPRNLSPSGSAIARAVRPAAIVRRAREDRLHLFSAAVEAGIDRGANLEESDLRSPSDARSALATRMAALSFVAMRFSYHSIFFELRRRPPLNHASAVAGSRFWQQRDRPTGIHNSVTMVATARPASIPRSPELHLRTARNRCRCYAQPACETRRRPTLQGQAQTMDNRWSVDAPRLFEAFGEDATAQNLSRSGSVAPGTSVTRRSASPPKRNRLWRPPPTSPRPRAR